MNRRNRAPICAPITAPRVKTPKSLSLPFNSYGANPREHGICAAGAA
jgi:hypothetical protein